jgi:hypothetical protein
MLGMNLKIEGVYICSIDLGIQVRPVGTVVGSTSISQCSIPYYRIYILSDGEESGKSVEGWSHCGMCDCSIDFTSEISRGHGRSPTGAKERELWGELK